MSKPPPVRNVCLTCSHTWHPKAQKLAAKCPACGSKSVMIQPEPKS